MPLINPRRWFDDAVRKAGASLQRTASWVVPIGTTASAVLLSFGTDSGWKAFWWGVVLAALVIVFSAAGSRASHLERQDAIEVAADTTRTTNSLALGLDSILRTAAEAAPLHAQQRREAFGRLAQQLVQAVASAYSSREKLRSVLYELCYDSDGEATALDVVAHAATGSREDPRVFTNEDERGRSAISFVIDGKRHRCRYVEDLDNEADHQQGWHGTGHQYRTYISVAVLAESTPYGMITIDAPNVDDITEADTSQMQLAAGAAAILFAVRPRSVRGGS